MIPSKKQMLWWGRSDPDYSRNSVVRQNLAAQGWEIRDFHPKISALGDITAALFRTPTPDVVWVPCFRQRDLAAARRWCYGKGIPLIFDPLISAYDKQVHERFKLKDTSRAARRLLNWEQKLFAKPDLVLADTTCHAEFFKNVLCVPEHKIRVVYVGADETLFSPAHCPAPRDTLDVLFYGSFIPLHGAQTIVDAARVYKGPPVQWSLLGDGPTKPACQTAAAGLTNVLFEDRIPYKHLPARVHSADILLGVFGTTQKAGRVIPNKVFQALAAGRPVITRLSDAYPQGAFSSESIAFVSPGDPHALAAKVAEWATHSDALAQRGHAAKILYDAEFSSSHIRRQLSDSLDVLKTIPVSCRSY
jgi:glycosyltransferase involved in cell wall biosynthesis